MKPNVMLLIAIIVSCLVVALTVKPRTNKQQGSAYGEGRPHPGYYWTTSVQHRSKGCFHDSEETINLYAPVNKSSDFLVEYMGERTSRVFNISPAQNDSVLSFIKQLESLGDEELRCSTVNTYHVNYKGKIISRMDGSCAFAGYWVMREALKLPVVGFGPSE
jgi:hypothetical protein